MSLQPAQSMPAVYGSAIKVELQTPELPLVTCTTCEEVQRPTEGWYCSLCRAFCWASMTWITCDGCGARRRAMRMGWKLSYDCKCKWTPEERERRDAAAIQRREDEARAKAKEQARVAERLALSAARSDAYECRRFKPGCKTPLSTAPFDFCQHCERFVNLSPAKREALEKQRTDKKGQPS